MNSPQTAAQALPGHNPQSADLAIEKRVAAYAYFCVAGMGTASLGFFVLMGFSGLLRVLTHPEQAEFWFVALAGAAALIAALAVGGPFLRAARAGRRWRVYGWVLLGVLASHAVYGLLTYVQGLLFERGTAPPSMALFMALFSLMLGFLPNMALGIGFAEGLLWMGRRRPA